MEAVFTERAHLMCPNMCFGITAIVNYPYDPARIQETLAHLSAAHPFLNALLGYEEVMEQYVYRITDASQVELLLKENQISGLDALEILAEYERLTHRDWNLFEEGMLKATVWPCAEKTCFLLVFHHLLADGRGALGLMQELSDDYALGQAPKPVPEHLISSTSDFPENSGLSWISRTLVKRANKQWIKENQHVTYAQYHAFANTFLKEDPVRHGLTRITEENLDQIRRQCHEIQVSINDYLIAKLMIEENASKVIIAADLRDRLSCYQEGALGNYSTAFSVEIKKKSQNPQILARTVHKAVQKKMLHPSDLYLILQCYASLEPGLLDAALIACRGDFPSKAGKFIGSMFFGFAASSGHSITNLGRIESRSLSAACFIPPASPAMKKTLGVLTVNNEMYICTSER